MGEADGGSLRRVEFGGFFGRESFRLPNLSHDLGNGVVPSGQEWDAEERTLGLAASGGLLPGQMFPSTTGVVRRQSEITHRILRLAAAALGDA